MLPPRDAVYIGDAVYASFDGYHIVLQTSDGYRITNQIFLDPDVFLSLNKFALNLTKDSSSGGTNG